MIKFNNKDNIPKINSEELSRVVYNDKVIFPKKENVIYINQVETDPAKKITGDVKGDVIRAIRRGSHRYVLSTNRTSLDYREWTLVAKQLDDSDSTKYADGTDASQAIAGGEVIVHIPEFWYYGTEGDNVEIHFTMEDPGDDDKWVHWDGNTLIGAYEGVSIGIGDTSTGIPYISSRSGYPSVGSISQEQSTLYTENAGKISFAGSIVEPFPGFQLVDWEMQNVIAILFYAWYGNTNCQAICGSGTASYEKETGQTNSLGMTDTTTENGNNMSTNFWGLENWWGNKYEWMQDVITTGNGGITVNTPKSGGDNRALSLPVTGNYIYPNKMKFGKYCDCIAVDSSGSFSTGYCDRQYCSPYSGDVAVRSLNNAHTGGGIICIDTGYDPTDTNASIGARLCYRGPFTITK